MADRLLLRGGSVVSMDPDVGDLPKGDVLIEGDAIAQIAPDISADAQEIDATGKVVIPGFIDSHRHTWEAAIRGCAPDATLDDYFVDVLDTFAPVYRPEDVYASNLAGALECVNAGITTLLDWSHINNTPDHPDAGVQGLQDVGHPRRLRVRQRQPLAERLLEREHDRHPGGRREARPRHVLLLHATACSRWPWPRADRASAADDVVRAEWNMARELGLPITVHVGMGRLAGRFGMIKQLEGLGLLGDDTTYIHCCYFSDEEWDLVRDTGGRISIAPQVEMQMGHGSPPIPQSRERGLRPSLSIDVVTTVPGDMFTQMRCAFGCERVRVNADAWQKDEAIPEGTLSARDTLEMATRNGAYTVGLEDAWGRSRPASRPTSS